MLGAIRPSYTHIPCPVKTMVFDKIETTSVITLNTLTIYMCANMSIMGVCRRNLVFMLLF